MRRWLFILLLLATLPGWGEMPKVGISWPFGTIAPSPEEGFVNLGERPTESRTPLYQALDTTGQPTGFPRMTPEGALADWLVAHEPENWPELLEELQSRYPDSRELTRAKGLLQRSLSPGQARESFATALELPDRELLALQAEALLAQGETEQGLSALSTMGASFLSLAWPALTGFEPTEALKDWVEVEPEEGQLKRWELGQAQLWLAPAQVESAEVEWRFGPEPFWLEQRESSATFRGAEASLAFHLEVPRDLDATLWSLLPRLSVEGMAWRTVGRSVQGRSIDIVRLGHGEDLTLFFGAFHGDEPAGRGLLEYLVGHLQQHPELLRGRTVIICPVLNPDGYEAHTRSNHNGVDLNRNYPTGNWSSEGRGSRWWGGPKPASEPETAIVLELLKTYKPDKIVSIHAPLHNVNFDGPARQLAHRMSSRNGYKVEPDIGYPTPGSFGTFAGREGKIPTITLELPEGTAEKLWPENREALLEAIFYTDKLTPVTRPKD